jgi:plastocyanin
MDNKAITVALAVFVVVTVAACGGGDAPTAGSSTQAAAPAGAIDPASITDPGTISGTINFGGAAPEGQLLQMAADPYCITSHAGSEVMSQRVVVNDNGTLRHVFVYVKEGLGDQAFIASGSSIELSQEGCMYTPHVLGVQANQAVTIVNNDDTLHNINGQPSGDGNNPFNFAQPIKGMSTEVTFPSAEMIPVKCDVHPWMQAYIGVTNHPYFAVSSEDGSFTINNLPAGDYTIAAWHESLGEQTQNVMVGASATAEISFDFGN